MITLSRALARQLVSLLTKTLDLPRSLLLRQGLRFVVDETGLTVESATATKAIRYRDRSYRGLPQSWEAPLTAVQFLAKSAAMEGELSLQGEAEVHVRVIEKTLPREEGFSLPDLVLETPVSPEAFVALPASFRKSVIAAFETVEPGEPGRYALNCVQLQGSKQSLAATDGRQLLIQAGIDWPFEEDLLLANYRKLFRCKEFPGEAIELGKTEHQVVFRAGDWEFFLPIETSRSYPKVEDVLPAPSEAVAHLEISHGDAVYLKEVLPHLPFDEFDYERGVTLELNGRIGVRAQSMKNPAGVEVVLRNSRRSGSDLLCAMQRGYLQRALELGLRRFEFFQSGCAPIVVRQEETIYCWATYDPSSAFKATPETEIRQSPPEQKSQIARRSAEREIVGEAVIASGWSKAQETASREQSARRELRNQSGTAGRVAVWRWLDAAKAG